MYGAPLSVQITPIIISHLSAAAIALLVGTIMIFMKKGTSRHKQLGRFWVGLMLFTALSSFWIGSHFSWIHGLSMWVLFCLFMALIGIRVIGGLRGRRLHAGFMIGTYAGLWSAAIPAALTEGRLTYLLLFG